MPTPHRSGAPVLPIPLVTPAFKGLNKQAETAVLGPDWATAATNAVFDSAGRLGARRGWQAVTTSSVASQDVEQIFQQIYGDGTTELISSCNSKLWKGSTTLTDITGTATVTVGNNWQFVNFDGQCYGFQQGEQPIGRTTGDFADSTAASGSWPQGNCAVVHSGRIWAADSDKQTIKYCALLGATHWTTGAGSIDMSSVWPNGMDEIVALVMFNGAMVVFGKNQIVLFGDGQGSALGIDPANIYVVDTIVGTGCISRDSVQQIDGGDLLFLSSQGVQSLGRLIQEKSNPIFNISANIRDYFVALLEGEDKALIRSVYSPEESFYLLVLPTFGIVFCFDTSSRLPDGALRVTEWNMLLRAVARAIDGAVYMSLSSGAGGKIGQYTGSTDNGIAYIFDYVSAWLDLGPELSPYIKILKNIHAIVYSANSATVFMKWDVDFQDSFTGRTVSVFAQGTSEWGEMEWGEDQWSGGLALRNIGSPASGSGQYIRVGLSASISGDLSIQQLTLYTKIGRLARI